MRFVNAISRAAGIALAAVTLAAVTLAARPAGATGSWREAALRDARQMTDDEAAWPLLSRLAQADTAPAEQPAEAAETPAEESRPEHYSGVMWTIQEWLARANREFQGVVVKGLSTPAQTELAQPKDGNDPIAEKIRETETPPAPDAAPELATPAPETVPEAPATTAAQTAQPQQQPNAAADAARARREADRQRQAAAADARAAAEKAKLDKQRRAAADAQRKADARQRAEEQRALAEAAELRRRTEERRRAAEVRAETARETAARETEDRDERLAATPKVNTRQFELIAEPLPERQLRSTRRRVERDVEQEVVIESEDMIVERPDPVARPRAVSRPYPVRTYAVSARRRAVAGWHRIDRRRLRRHRQYRSVHHRRRRAACRRTGRRVSLPGRYVVARGDNLWRISRRHYARGRYYRTIYRANRSRIADPELIYPGQRLRMPRRHR